MNNVLIVAPHGDDEILGTGIAISHHLNKHDAVTVFSLQLMNSKRDCAQAEASQQAKDKLKYTHLIRTRFTERATLYSPLYELIKEMDEVICEVKPTVLYFPWYGDHHQDHRYVAESCSSAIRVNSGHFVKSVYMYETPSSTDQGTFKFTHPFTPNTYIAASSAMLEKKCSCIGFFTTEQHPMRTPGAIRDLAVRRGRESNQLFAEAFFCVRNVI